jgi:hypothetical protein
LRRAAAAAIDNEKPTTDNRPPGGNFNFQTDNRQPANVSDDRLSVVSFQSSIAPEA